MRHGGLFPDAAYCDSWHAPSENADGSRPIHRALAWPHWISASWRYIPLLFCARGDIATAPPLPLP